MRAKVDVDREYQRSVGYWAIRQKNWAKRGILFHGKPLTAEIFKALLDFQDHRCAISDGDERWLKLAAEHDHKNGELRGAVDGKINHHAVGTYEKYGHYKSPIHEALLAAYLASPPAQSTKFLKFLKARGIKY